MVERMNDGSRRAMTGSIHRIREFELEKVCLVEEFDIVQIVGEGWFGKILLVEHRATDTEMVLKALPKPYVSIKDFYREFHYGLHLSAHRNIVTTYDVAFETAGFYVFSQEYAPLGDLTSNMVDTGIGELHSKRVAKQLAAALEHMHQRELVHRDVKLDNILIYKADFSRVKLCDFGETRRTNSSVRRRNEWLPYSPPEVLKLPVDSSYRAQVTHDIWQFGIVLFICLTGCLPWQKAAFDDPRYLSYFNWYSSANPLKKQPKLFKMVSSKAQKLFKKLIEPRIERRANNFSEISKYIDDRWMAKGYQDRVAGSDIDELCPSMYSFHSDVNEKNILLKHFLEHGIETTVDRQAKKERIRDWIQNSVIVEETEEDEINANIHSSDDEQEDELSAHRHNDDKHAKATLRYATEKHINPRTGEVIEGANKKNDKKLSYDAQNIEPVASINMSRKIVNQEESNTSQSSSNKDSAYGSLDFKSTVTNTRSNSLENAKGSPSRSQSNISLPKPNSPLPKHIQRLMEVNSNRSNSPEIRNSEQSLNESNSCRNINPNFSLRSNDNKVEINNQLAKTYSPKIIRGINDQSFYPINLTRSNDTVLQVNNQIPKTYSPRNTRKLDSYDNQIPTKDKFNGIVHKNSYKSMKDTAYDAMLGRKDSLKEDTVVEESPYTSMMNIVQGQIQFQPYAQAGVSSNDRVINVTITSLGNQRMNN